MGQYKIFEHMYNKSPKYRREWCRRNIWIMAKIFSKLIKMSMHKFKKLIKLWDDHIYKHHSFPLKFKIKEKLLKTGRGKRNTTHRRITKKMTTNIWETTVAIIPWNIFKERKMLNYQPRFRYPAKTDFQIWK